MVSFVCLVEATGTIAKVEAVPSLSMLYTGIGPEIGGEC